MNNARLLEKVSYCSRKQSKKIDLNDVKIQIKDTFPLNPESKTSPGTAKSWAKMYERKTPDWEPTIETFDNTPREYTIISLDVRSEGGRAYKVIDSENRQFDFREDQLLEVLKLKGISPGGKMLGEFVWGVAGSQVKLALVGGKLHTEMVKTLEKNKTLITSKKNGTAVTPGKLVSGHVYKKRDGSHWAFVGRVVLPGESKTSYAIVEMPRRAPSVLNDQGLHMQIDGWRSMTWSERVKIENECYIHHDNFFIVMTKAPTFEEECGECDITEFKLNVLGKYSYMPTYSNSIYDGLAELHFHPGGYYPSEPSCNMNLSWDERQRIQVKFYDEEKKKRHGRQMKYNDLLVWKN